MKRVKVYLMQYVIAAAMLLFILFFIGMWVDDEFHESRGFFFKYPPTIEWKMSYSPNDPPLDSVRKAKYYEEEMRDVHYDKLQLKQGALGELLAGLVMQIFLITLFIKPILPRRFKHILLDLLLLLIGYVLSHLIYGLFNFKLMYVTDRVVWFTLFLFTLLVVNFLLFRVLRPAKKYRLIKRE